MVGSVTLIFIAALAFTGYQLLKPDSAEAGNFVYPVDTSNTAATSSPSGSTPADKSQGAQTTEPAVKSQPADDNKAVTTVDHGSLPKFGTVAPSGKMDGLKKLIQDYTKKQSGKYGVTFIDLATGEMVNVNDQVEYIAASTSKLPINVLLYKNIEAGKVKLTDKLTYQKEDLEYGTGIIQKSSYGTKYTVQKTSELAIKKSDNCGVNMIIRLLGIENVRQYIVGLGGKVYYGPRHRSCPYDMALVAKDLYNSYLNNETVYGELINNLENTDWNDRINGKLPKTVKVAHKIGNQTKTANDVGIVFASHPYVLSVMTDNVDFTTACRATAELSKMIYDYEESYAAK